ncbi:methyltransferase domain protein (macronuclear) [Tetrahymena thermophila SB210]|uniref:Methyltransferase domain protein n=1 Tax=Tetrahymena thermophila (strain SB210) TaxID=312017 RepID=Q22Z04_TETTS|nr:methyltransferase domain protein [Tetrahymena thermophila SB210]EAR90517.1 methyltransferase domain protein [Tetrahymena thermophila SB210]|eukprot:XP_001010762.1 methyltransferase domain protein [Tetrahymena thermophila SB210]
MNILPKNYGEFQSKQYWDKFFRKLKKQNDKKDSEFFEWYGNFKNFQHIISQIVKEDQKILNIGCGNSLFSEDMYDGGFKNIVNCDFSEDVIKEMSARSAKIRPEMKYEVVDIFNMTYAPNSFDIVMDKGLLDAVYPEETEENTTKINKFLQSIVDILTANPNSRYVCISLLQSHILNTLLTFFNSKNFEITIHEVLIEKSKLYPFLVDIKRSDNPTATHNKINLHLKNEAEAKLLPPQEIKHQINRIQTQNRFMSQVKKCHAGQRFSIEVWDPKVPNAKVPKYTLHVVDSNSKKILENKTCGCFITPQGKEQSYISSTEKGNFELLEQAGYSRLIIAILNPGYVFSSMKEVQDELCPAVNDLIPKGCKNLPVPFITDGDEIGDKDVIAQNEEFIIEEILNEEGHALRRLVLKNNISAIQSQYKMTYFSAKNRPDLVEQNKLTKSILPPKKNMVIGIDESYLDFESHRAMIAGLSLLGADAFEKKELNILVLGAGLCALSKFIYNHFANTKLNNIEISKNIVEAAKIHFGVDKDPRFKITIDNAFSYIKNHTVNEEAPKVEKEGSEIEEAKESKTAPKKKQQYDIIVIDIVSPQENQASPPEQFLQEEFLQKLQKLLENNGLLMINYIGTHQKECDTLLQTKLSKVFDLIYSYKTENELNDVLFAVNTKFKRDVKIDNNNQKEELIIVEKDQIKQRKELEINFKQIMKKAVKPWDFTLNIDTLCTKLMLRYPQINTNTLTRTNVYVDQGDNKMVNSTKQQYENDLGKVLKKEQKKSKNKKK